MGLMSGTSMDGVDAAWLSTDGDTIAAFGPVAEVAPAYSARERALLAAAGEAAAAAIARGEAPGGETLRAATAAVDRVHAAAVTILSARSDTPPDVVGYHGQTVFHAPDAGRTVQLGDGAALARAAGCPVVSDFRSADMAAGGQGAPLAPFFHWALARHVGEAAPVAFLNIGGVANVTWVDPAAPAPEADGALLSFDTGPGNALIDDWMTAHGAGPHDRDGAAAAAGRVATDRMRGNALAAFLDRPPPKSLDRNAFSAVSRGLDGLSLSDGAATLTALTADCVAAADRHMPRPVARWLVAGGGRRNPTLMRMLAERLPAPVVPVEAAGLDGDMLEAQAFAWLAVRVLRGLPLSAPGTTGCARPVTGGRVDRPGGAAQPSVPSGAIRAAPRM